MLEVLKALGKVSSGVGSPTPVLVTQMDRSRAMDYQAVASELRRAGIPAELYLGKGSIGKQLKYADERGTRFALIAGEDEFANDTISIKDLGRGKEIASGISDRVEWLKREQTQVPVPREELVARIKELLGKPDENSLGAPDVAEPIRVFIVDHLTDELRAAFAEPGERIVDVLHGEHDA